MDVRPNRWFCPAYGLWLFGAIAYFLPAATWNPVSRFDLTRAIVEQGSLSIDSFADDTGDHAFADGHWYSDKAPIPALLAVPAYAAVHAWERASGDAPAYTVIPADSRAGDRVRVNDAFRRGLYACSLSTAGLAGALLGVLLFEALRRVTTPAIAFASAASLVLGTPIFPYATSFYGHTIAAAFLFAAFAAGVPWPEAGERATGSRPVGPVPQRAAIAGGCLALATGSEYILAAPSLVLACFVLVRAPRGERLRSGLALAAGASIPCAVVAAYHAQCFGAPWRTAYSFIASQKFAAGHATGLLGIHAPSADALGGILVGPRRGLFYLAPVTLAAAGALVVSLRRPRDPGASPAALVLATLLVLNAGYYMWWGGACTGPRHLVPALGMLSFGMARAWEARRMRVAMAALAVLSVANMLVLTGVGLEAPEHGDALLGYAWPSYLAGKAATLSGASNWGIKLGLPRGASLGPIAAWVACGWWYFARELARPESGRSGLPRSEASA